MTSLPIDALSILDVVLIVALLATAAYAIGLRREFKRFRGYNAEYAEILAQTGRAMEGVERAVESVQTEGASVLAALGERIEEARSVMERLEAARQAPAVESPRRARAARLATGAAEAIAEAAAAAPAFAAAAPAETPAPFRPRPDQKPKAYAWPTVVVKRLPDDA
ncbi:hypothetical protein [Salinarimonas ramus]|uniref:Uncharacterized protein n=1 Tax=Salinarimonas ramus TaxID=690164 RepID=A0A917Q6T9_9HYPH|nr:hypothetical protein [Salinarimonas ramus]GGK31099.1 hypothetical protein GCM10011322_17150 [Salinarimonas ramus]